MHTNHRFLIFGLTVLLAGFTAACESRQDFESFDEESRRLDPTTGEDAEAAREMSQSHAREVLLANDAVPKASREDIRDYAQMLAEDHSDALNELNRIIADKGMAGTPEQTNGAQTQELRNLDGPTFDRRFLDLMVENHEATLLKLRQWENTLRDEELREYVSDLRPTVEHHLEVARELQAGSISRAGDRL